MTRRTLALAALLAAATWTSGCAVSVGSTHQRSQSERLDRLEQRILRAETELGIAVPKAVQR